MELYTIPIPDADQDDAHIIYRPLLGLAFLGNREMVDLAKSLVKEPSQPVTMDKDVHAFLQKIGFLKSDPPPPKEHVLRKFSPVSLTLLMTNQCQLRCKYCYAAAGENPREEISLEAGYAAIDYTYENLKRLNYPRFHISLHGGGEPTMAWKKMKAFVAYAKEKPILTEFSLTSNGIWSEQQAQWIMAYIDYVGISMDGSPQTQNAQRPMASGKGSSPWVMRTLKMLDENHRPYRLRLTAMPPFEHLSEDIRFICENTNCKRIQVEAAFTPQRGGGYQYELEEGLKFLEAFMYAQRLAETYGCRLTTVGSRIDKITTISCGALYNALIVTPQDEVVACFEVVNDKHPLAELLTIGRITPQGVEIDEEARLRLDKKIIERRASCRDCSCYWSCAGGCVPRTFSPGPNGHLEHGAYCELRRTLQREMLLRHISAGNGVWHRPSQRSASGGVSTLAKENC
ncbi:MAG: radical SAM protein [Anaerolineales bacterium]|nr:radical SAM protein [Anaerolineales bacterium]